MPNTRSQLHAQRAFQSVEKVEQEDWAREYRSFATSFPSIIHTCGLAQAVAFAQAKGAGSSKDPPKVHESKSRSRAVSEYLEDLARVLETSTDDLAAYSRESQIASYLRLSRDALAGSVWLKRYAEALLPRGE